MYGVVGSYPDAYEGVCSASPVAYHALKGSSSGAATLRISELAWDANGWPVSVGP